MVDIKVIDYWHKICSHWKLEISHSLQNHSRNPPFNFNFLMLYHIVIIVFYILTYLSRCLCSVGVPTGAGAPSVW